MGGRSLTIRKLLATTTIIACALYVATRLDGEPTPSYLYITFLTGAVLALVTLGFLRLSDAPLATLLMTPFAWAAALTTWQNSLFGAIAISPFTFAVPAFENIWKTGLPSLFGLLLLFAYLNPSKRSLGCRMAICKVGCVPIATVAGLRSYERANWAVGPYCLAPASNQAEIDSEELAGAIERILAPQKD